MKMENIVVDTKIGKTKFLIEARPTGLWSDTPEISIAHELDGKRSQFAPSIPLESIPEFVQALLTQYAALVKQTAK